eukprot:m.125326 g.125326  ORF g.125326 m.125326 type:complete len:226 (+) comp16651_c0_seq1:1460-2137(+)
MAGLSVDVDELDDLLQDVEALLAPSSSTNHATCSRAISKASTSSSSSSSRSAATSSKPKKQAAMKKQADPDSEVDLDDLDDILNELGDGPELRPLPNDLQRRKSVSDRTKTEVTKCFPALVGGTALATGQNKSGAANRACSRLHCTACDFKICTFDDCSWDADKCDYLFFRNNVPDFHKLKVNLVPTKGTRAYACQCCWRSVRETEPVASLGSDLRWVCGRHPTT